MIIRIIIAASLLTASAAFAQSTAGIVGLVKDSSGARIASCHVQATETDTKIKHLAECNHEGYYVFPVLRPTNYDVTITSEGFATYTSNAVILQANQTYTVDANLVVGSLGQTIEVQANSAAIDTSTGTLSTVIDQAQIHNLPLDGRNVAALTTLVAGAVTAPDARATQGLTIPVDVTTSTNGTRANQISYRLDGANNTDELTNVNAPFPFPDALQEFSMQTSNYSAEYGDSSGAAVNIVTASGTNRFHGDAFEYIRNNVFNARNYFAPSVDTLKRNQYGFTFGGPIVHDKIFFFMGYQGTRIRNSASGQLASGLPTDAMRTGNYSALLDANSTGNPYGTVIPIIDPQTGLPFPGNIIPTNRLDPVSQKLLAYLPSGGTTGTATYTLPANQTYDEWVARVDYHLSEKDQLTFRYYVDNYKKEGAFTDNNLFTLVTNRSIPSTSALVQEQHVFSPSLINDVRLSYLRINGRNTTPSGVPNYSSLGSAVNQDPLPSTINDFTTNQISIGAGWPVVWVRNQFELSDDLHWVHGKHNLAFGARAERDRFDNTNTNGTRPQAEFYGDFTGLDLADFSLGLLNSFSQSALTVQRLRGTRLSFYANDSIHVSPRLTLNAGVRYEPFLPWQDTNNQLQSFSLDAYKSGVHSSVFTNAPAGLLFPGDKGFRDGGVGKDLNNISPRLGFAWDVFGTGKTSVRGGGGTFYDSRQVFAANMILVPAPYTYSLTFTDQGTLSNPYQGTVDPFPYTNLGLKNPGFKFQSPLTASTYDQSPGKYVTPTTYNWNLIVEQQLPYSTIFRLAYVGSRGSHLLETYNVNPAVYTPGDTRPTNARRIIQGYGAINSIHHDANSIYHSLQVTASHRMASGLTLLANYTFSKNMDDLPAGTPVNSGSVNPVLPNYLRNFHRLDYGPADFDRTSVASVSYVWAFPKLTSGDAIVRAVLNGWETTGIIQAESGDPLTIVAEGDFSKTNQRSDRAVFAGGSPYSAGACLNQPAPCVDSLDPTKFTTPATGTFGNVVKGSFRGPKLFNWDAGVLRKVAFKEGISLQFKAEFFNVINHTNFQDPDNAITDNNFGTITGSSAPRIGQLALTLSF